jgi:hypothetical protein
VFDYFAGQAVAEYPLKLADEFVISIRDPIEKRKEQRAIAVRPYRRDLGHKIFDTMGAQDARLQVDRTVGRIQQPRIGVPLVDRRRKAPIRARQRFNGGNRLGALDLDGGFVVELLSGHAADISSKITSMQRVVMPPLPPLWRSH